MANYPFNIVKGRMVELYNRAENNDPTNSALILVPCSASDTEANAQDADDLTAALATAINEQTGGGWVRKTLESVQLASLPAPDDTNNRYDISLPAVTWTAPTGGSDTTGLLVCYDSDTTGGADTAILPGSHHDFAVTADGNDVILNAGVFYRAA
jgi:hypothetical protein